MHNARNTLLSKTDYEWTDRHSRLDSQGVGVSRLNFYSPILGDATEISSEYERTDRHSRLDSQGVGVSQLNFYSPILGDATEI